MKLVSGPIGCRLGGSAEETRDLVRAVVVGSGGSQIPRAPIRRPAATTEVLMISLARGSSPRHDAPLETHQTWCMIARQPCDGSATRVGDAALVGLAAHSRSGASMLQAGIGCRTRLQIARDRRRRTARHALIPSAARNPARGPGSDFYKNHPRRWALGRSLRHVRQQRGGETEIGQALYPRAPDMARRHKPERRRAVLQ
jgi:hypothetical protein